MPIKDLLDWINMIYEICKMVLFRIWLGPIVRDLFEGIYEVINGLLLMSMTQLKRCKKIKN